ncbi:MAG: ComEC/Rec2 family competence protein [Clostridiales bacterium]|nr:ComEC/Rec2 family competence protein [Clostridiales bacterium]
MIWIAVTVSLGVLASQILPVSFVLSLLILALGSGVLCLFINNRFSLPLFAFALTLARVLWLPSDFFSLSSGSAFAFLLPVRAFFIRALDALFGSDNGFARGILLGDKTEISRDLMTSFANNGLVHLLSVSGLHVNIIARTTKEITKPFPPWPRLALRMLLVLFYVGLTGFNAPSVRAALMLLGLWIAIPLRRQEDAPSAFLFSFAGVVFLMPEAWGTASFQISFACMFGLLALERPIRYLLRLPEGKLFNVLSGTLAVTVTLLPLFTYYFGGVSWISPFVSVLVLPVVPLITLSGFYAMLVYPLLPAVGSIIAAPARLGLWGITKLMELLDVTLLPLPRPHVAVIAVYLIGILFLSPFFLPNRKKGLPIIGLTLFALSILLWIIL